MAQIMRTTSRNNRRFSRAFRNDPFAWYISQGQTLFQVKKWNSGYKKGKQPLYDNWRDTDYDDSMFAHFDWFQAGYNLGFLIPEHIVVLDVDPRNFEGGIDSREMIAELLGCLDYQDVIETYPSVRTSEDDLSGLHGYHHYLLLPDGYDYRDVRPKADDIPGVDIKRHGGYTLAAGSRHPSGDYYVWANEANLLVAPERLLEHFKYEVASSDMDSRESYGALNGKQLKELFLDNLDVTCYRDNDSWYRIMAASHYVTAGNGLEEFLEWSLSDDDYWLETDIDERSVVNRWESMRDDENKSNITAGTLIWELEEAGGDSSQLRAVLSFAEIAKTEEDSPDADFISHIDKSLEDVDLSGYEDLPIETGEAEEYGKALKAVDDISPNPNDEQFNTVLRTIRAAGKVEKIRAIKKLATKIDGLTVTEINKELKALDTSGKDSLQELLTQTVINKVFNDGKHITVEPDGSIWIYVKPVWVKISDNYLGNIFYRVIDRMNLKMDINKEKLTLVENGKKAILFRMATSKSILFDKDRVLLPIWNFRNKAVFINKKGQIKIEDSNYKHYQTNYINCDYDEFAECPKFDKFLRQLYQPLDDVDAAVAYAEERLALTAHPVKYNTAMTVLEGSGANGKSTLINIMASLFGDKLLRSDCSIFKIGSGYSERFKEESLIGKNLIVIEEVPKRQTFDETGIKLLSENKLINTRAPYGKGHFDFMYTGGLIVATNHPLRLKAYDPGLMRRIYIVPHNAVFNLNSDIKLDRNIYRNIAYSEEEKSGIANRLINALISFLKADNNGRRDESGALLPDSAEFARKLWHERVNVVAEFANVRLIQKGGSKVLARDVYDAYREFVGYDNKPLGRNTFYSELRDLGIECRRSAGNDMFVFDYEFVEDLNDISAELAQDDFAEFDDL